MSDRDVGHRGLDPAARPQGQGPGYAAAEGAGDGLPGTYAPVPDPDQDLAETPADAPEESPFHRLCWPSDRRFCPRCRGFKIYGLADARFRCGGCGYTFRDFSGRWIGNGALSPEQWTALAGLFTQEASVLAMSKALSISYNTAYKAATALRFSLAAQSMDAGTLFGPEHLGRFLKGRRLTVPPRNEAETSRSVFGILEKQGWVFIDLLPRLKPEDVFHFSLQFHLGLARLGSMVYSDRYRQYDGLILCADESLPLYSIRKGREPVFMDRTDHGFWNFARHRIKVYKGVSPGRFPLYLKELEYRYNHRGEELTPLLLDCLCSFMPDPAEDGGRAASRA
jgi:transposase